MRASARHWSNEELISARTKLRVRDETGAHIGLTSRELCALVESRLPAPAFDNASYGYVAAALLAAIIVGCMAIGVWL